MKNHNPFPSLVVGEFRRIQSVPNAQGGCTVFVREMSLTNEQAEYLARAVNSYQDLRDSLQRMVDASRESDATALAMRIDAARQLAEHTLRGIDLAHPRAKAA